MLKRFDRALRLAEDRRRLAVREVEDELQREHLLLLGREVFDQLEHALTPDRLHRLFFRRRLLGRRRLGHLLLGLPTPGGTEVVHRQVVRDPEEPSREGRRLPLEAADRLEHLQERLRRQVLGVMPVAEAHVQVAVDAVEMEEVELFQRRSLTLLRALDQPPQLPRRLACPRPSGLGRFVRHPAQGMPGATRALNAGEAGPLA